MIIFFLLFILLLILFLIIISNNNYKEVVKKEVVKKEVVKKEVVNNNDNSYFKYGDEENLKDEIIGYENELMYENNLKEGDYINQFDTNDIINKDDNQIGFNPKPREQMKQLPYANINFKCL
jgi:uncharacterized membrane protein